MARELGAAGHHRQRDRARPDAGRGHRIRAARSATTTTCKGRAIQRPQVPEDVTAAALFLLTRASGFITGQLLPVNGGFVMN